MSGLKINFHNGDVYCIGQAKENFLAQWFVDNQIPVASCAFGIDCHLDSISHCVNVWLRNFRKRKRDLVVVGVVAIFGEFGKLGTLLVFKISGQLIQFLSYIAFAIGFISGVLCE
jgi:hypothetical protein